MTDISWTIHTKDDGSLTLPGAIGTTMPTIGAGRTLTIELLSDDDGTAYDTLREYARYTNDSLTNTGTDIRGKPWYHENVHPTADYSTGLVRVEPGAGVGDLRSWWGVITGASISTNSIGTNRRIILTIYILAEGSEYGNRTLVEETFRAGL